jgi:predicted ATPase
VIWINLAKDRDQGRAVLKLVTNFEVLQNFIFCILYLLFNRRQEQTKATDISETLVPVYQTTWRHITKNPVLVQT